jgi:hypothetical protein
MVFYWNKGSDGRRFNTKQYFHPQHWLDKGMDYLRMNPYTAGNRRGPKPRLTLTYEQKAERLRLLRTKATLEQRKRQLDISRPDYLAAVTALEIKVLDTIQAIAPLGGVPPSWMEKL